MTYAHKVKSASSWAPSNRAVFRRSAPSGQNSRRYFDQRSSPPRHAARPPHSRTGNGYFQNRLPTWCDPQSFYLIWWRPSWFLCLIISSAYRKAGRKSFRRLFFHSEIPGIYAFLRHGNHRHLRFLCVSKSQALALFVCLEIAGTYAFLRQEFPV